MNIGFDLDRVFINYPPTIPPKIIDWLYRKHCTTTLTYRFPKNSFEKFFRKLTHFTPLRPHIKQNVEFVNKLADTTSLKLYLISSRYQFLEKLTHKILKKYNLLKPFSGIYLNLNNQQPHLFKEETIKKLKIDLFIDDDLDLLKYLKEKCPAVKLLWYNPSKKHTDSKNIDTIYELEEIKKYIK